ncbi:MAG TPA: TetR/AcrR family transcriptional regulator [Gemmatimonadaceae bacterium]|jgi:AcrR family transcriptional regulator
MPNKPRTNVRKPTGGDTRTPGTKHALAGALIQLIQESGGFDQITVRQILFRAGVGRTAFYTHFRSKEDVLHSTYEGIFGFHKEQLQRDTTAKPRLFPVSEFLEHLAGARPVVLAFRKAGLADDMKSQFIGYAADIIECRIRELSLSTTVQPRLAARMLAAALIESLDWWLDHESISAAEIAAGFHSMAGTVVGPVGGGRDAVLR